MPPPTPSSAPTTVVVLAFGTRGDVQPLALLAAALVKPPHYHRVRFVSHAQHEPMLQALWGRTAAAAIDYVPSPSPPHAAGAGSSATTRDADSTEATLRPRAHLQACLQAVKQVLNLSSSSLSAVLIANLFALEAVHLAEVFQLPLVMAHPYPAPASLPLSFKAQFRRTDPLEYKALRKEGWREGGGEGGREGAHAGSGEVVSWEDVEHWLWPALAESWTPFRRMLMGLDEEGDEDELPLPWLAGRPAIPLLYLYSETILPRPQFFPKHAHVVGYTWPDENTERYTPPPALAAFLAGTAGGESAVEEGEAAASAAAAPPPTTRAQAPGLGWKSAAAAVAKTTTTEFCPAVGPVLVTFGTMVSLGALGDLSRAAATVVEAILSSSSTTEFSESTRTTTTTIRPLLRCVLDAAGMSSWAAALRQAISVHQQQQQHGDPYSSHRVFVLDEAVPHSWLLPKCSVVLHHGGSGTTAAALRAGVAQVTVPSMMDQFLWAERVAWLDLGPPPLALAELFPDDEEKGEDEDEEFELKAPSCLLAATIAEASHPSTRLRAAAVGRRLRAEPSGLDRCVELIHAHLEEWNASSISSSSPFSSRRPPLPLPLPAGCELLTLELLEEDDVRDGSGSSSSKQQHEREEDNKIESDAAATAAVSSALTVAALKGSESEIAFIHQEIFPPPGRQRQEKGGWGYLNHGVHVKEGDVVLDIGANIGLFALYLDLYAMEEPEQISILAVEPAPRTFEALEYNVAAHGVKLVACVQQAVGAGSGSNTSKNDKEQEQPAASQAILRFYPHAPGNSCLASAEASSSFSSSSLEGKTRFQGVNPRIRAHMEEGAEDVLVEMTSVSALVSKYALPRVDLLKVDVEGSEEAVLQGIDEGTWPLIRQVVVEVHDVEGRQGRMDALLRSQGFGKVVWETPAWAVGLGGDVGGERMDNRMVFACRK